MPDPITIGTALAAANAAFKGLKGAIQAGKEIHECAGTLAQWASAMSDNTYLDSKGKEKPSLWKSRNGSVEEQALAAFAAKKDADFMRSELKRYIDEKWGPSHWKELVALEGQIRKERKEQLYRKQEALDQLLSITVGIVIFIVAAGILGGMIYAVGSYRGLW